MKLDYSLSKEQLQAFSRLSCRRLAISRGARVLLTMLNIVAWVAIAIGTATLVGMYKTAPGLGMELNVLVIALVLAVVAWIASSAYRQRLQSNAVFADDSWLRIHQSMSAGPGGLEVTTPGAYSRYEWHRFSEVLEDAATIYLFLDVAHAIIVPKAAFASPDDLRIFLSWATAPSIPHPTPNSAP